MTTDDFEEHRSLLTGAAYRILGTAADAEDVVQEAWLRWNAVDRTAVDDPRAYLVTIASRLAIDRLRSARSRRESYVGEWLPEPVSDLPDGADHAELADTVEYALLVVLESLSPLERAVFVLREAFQFPYSRIAEIIGREEAATRQLARRARDHVRERRHRFDTDKKSRRRITERFLRAALEGDLEGLTALLADDAVLVADGGGKARSPLRILHGVRRVAGFFHGVARGRNTRRFLASAGLPGTEEADSGITEVNGAPAGYVAVHGRIVTLGILDVADGRIHSVYLVSNPDKLSRLRTPGAP
ncbi:RNA polymerase sigma factor SigJ [Nocardiopsis sp. CNT312]|uniref:RNA polymerase sigma factor SigJ n=1 Tax=Nocardiopsis sp. CNT312 TaxID=1137268 RepID=UPI0004901128|nr:RNA polymerase sigma factor SigJ [Nocardiopsis sp. CNT312]